LTVYGESYVSSSITDPYLVPGDSFNVSILATNIPAFSGADSGGISGFDITLDYNSSILKPVAAGFAAPRCPLSDNCVFDMPVNDTVIVHQSVDSPAGTTRLSVVGLGPDHRPDLSRLQGQPATLFRALFAIAGNGLTSISIHQRSSQLTSLSGGCGNLLPFTVLDLSFDNRAPFSVSATPSRRTVQPGQSFTTLVNVSIVNSAGYGIVNLTLSNYVPPLYTKALYNFNPVSGSLNNSGSGRSFTSHLTINTNSTAPLGTYMLTIIGVIPATLFNRGFQQNLNFPLTLAHVFPMMTAPQASLSHGTIISQTLLGYSPDTNTSSLLASFTTNNSPTAGTAVTFAAIAVWCSSPPYTLHWNFGDGSTGNNNPASHSYPNAGTYNVTLSVIDTDGNNYSSSQQVAVANAQQSSNLDPVIISSIVVLFLLLSTVFLLIRRQNRSRRS